MGIEVLPCCVNCKTGYVPLKNDVIVLETMDNKMIPYKLWSADLVQCPKCKHRLITGFGRDAFAEHYQTDFDAVFKKAYHSGLLFTISGQREAMDHWDKVTN